MTAMPLIKDVSGMNLVDMEPPFSPKLSGLLEKAERAGAEVPAVEPAKPRTALREGKTTRPFALD